MDVVMVATAAIYVGERQRPMEAGKVADLAQSIEQVGLLQPIGVVYDTSQPPANLRLVFGAHRLQAIRLLERLEVAAYVLPLDLHPEEYLLIELVENSARHDLTGAQRKAFAAEIGRLSAKLGELGNSANGREGWLTRLAEKTSVPIRTMTNWWNAFCHETALTLTPRQALANHRQQFFTWLDDHQRQADEEKARKEEEGFLAQRALCFQELQEELQEVIALYGWETVFDAVLAPLLEAHAERL